MCAWACKCWNYVVDFLAITLLIRGHSSSVSSLEIGVGSQRRENSLTRIIAETPTASFQYLQEPEKTPV
jgi:hypothetical protein